MTHFNPLEGTALLRRSGTYSEATLFERDGKIYAKRGSGYLRLLSHERTSVNKLFWVSITGTSFKEHAGEVLVSYPQLAAS